MRLEVTFAFNIENGLEDGAKITKWAGEIADPLFEHEPMFAHWYSLPGKATDQMVNRVEALLNWNDFEGNRAPGMESVDAEAIVNAVLGIDARN